jgi:hypothetical protein
VSRSLQYKIHDGCFAVCRLDNIDPLPVWATAGAWWQAMRTADDLSIVCEESAVPEGVRCQGGWRRIELAGPFDFAVTGILASVLSPLAAAGVPIFALSTFDTDWVLLPGEHLEKAKHALSGAGHNEI